MVNLDRLEVFVTVPEQDAQFVQNRQPVQLSFSEMPGQTFQGTVIRSSDSLSQQTRTLLTEIRDGPARRLRPGMFASVQMRYKPPNPGILIAETIPGSPSAHSENSCPWFKTEWCRCGQST